MAEPEANSVNGPGPVSDWEELGRRVFSRSAARKAASSGRIQPSIFLERAGIKKLSVDRLTCAEAAVDIARLVEEAGQSATNRPQPNTFCGWAVVNAEAVIRAGCSVEDDPLPNNRYHANIVLPESALENDEAQRGYAATLAGRAKWRGHPS